MENKRYKISQSLHMSTNIWNVKMPVPLDKKYHIFANQPRAQTRYFGWVAERLGRGLQNLVRRFESAPNLNDKILVAKLRGSFIKRVWESLLFKTRCIKELPRQRLLSLVHDSNFGSTKSIRSQPHPTKGSTLLDFLH